MKRHLAAAARAPPPRPLPSAALAPPPPPHCVPARLPASSSSAGMQGWEPPPQIPTPLLSPRFRDFAPTHPPTLASCHRTPTSPPPPSPNQLAGRGTLPCMPPHPPHPLYCTVRLIFSLQPHLTSAKQPSSSPSSLQLPRSRPRHPAQPAARAGAAAGQLLGVGSVGRHVACLGAAGGVQGHAHIVPQRVEVTPQGDAIHGDPGHIPVAAGEARGPTGRKQRGC